MAKKVLTYKEVNSRLGSSLPSTNKGCKKSKALEAGSKDMHPTWDSNRLIVYVEQDVVRYTLRFFDMNGNLIGTREFAEGTKPKRSQIPTAPEIEGYVFNGWSPYNPWTRTVTENKDFYARYVAGSGDPLEYFTIVSRGTEDITLHISNIYLSEQSYVDVSQVNYRVWDGQSKDDDDNKIFASYNNGVWTTNPSASWYTTDIDRGTQTQQWAGGIPYTDITVPQVPSGYEVQWKCGANRYAVTYRDNCYSYFEIDDAFEIKNNLLTLLYNTDVESLTEEDRSTMSNESSYCFCGLFRGCTNMTKASKLYFPTNLVGGEHHFSDMFMGCTNLTDAGFTASKGTLIDSAYERMFLGCTSLTKAPKLPSTSVNDHCYQAMFSGCTSLVNAPDLPATTLHYGCYDSMFGEYEYMGVTYSGCTNLKNIKMLGTYPGEGVVPTEWHRYSDVTMNTAHPLRNWVKGVASTGTFTGDNNWPVASSANEYEGKPW